MATFVGAAEAARLLGITKSTLYAYVSRGIIERRTAVDGRTSLYAREQIDELAARSRRRTPTERPTIDVQITSSITELQDEQLTYRGHDVAVLARTSTFEQVAELLWTGELPAAAPSWPIDRSILERCRSVIDSAGPIDSLTAMNLAASTLAGTADRIDDAGAADSATAARRLLAIVPSLLGGRRTGDMAARLASAYRPRPGTELVEAVSRALVLMADHELATSTLAVRVASSVRTNPYASIATGLSVVGGSLHGSAAASVHGLLTKAIATDPATAVREFLSTGRRLPGFGHTIYRNGDPRLAPLLEAVDALPDPVHRNPTVEAVLVEAGSRLGKHPNIDFGLGALAFIADLPADAPIFAVARIAGWAAHDHEERGERPVRFRGLATMR